jgi:hypothetical protein
MPAGNGPYGWLTRARTGGTLAGQLNESIVFGAG